jgi:hypothetical protein
MKLSNNRELYEYLLSLSSMLKVRGSEELSQLMTTASRHVAGMSTEFLGESRIALRKLAQDVTGILRQEEKADLLDVLDQLDTALDRRGR